jgi:hypothetical protein
MFLIGSRALGVEASFCIAYLRHLRK